MSRLKNTLESGQFAVTVELAPPKGFDFSPQLETAALLKPYVHGLNVTDMQSACLRASSLGLSIRLRQEGHEPILQVTGRDRSRMAVMGDVLSAAAFGVDTLLSVTGDHPVLGDCPQSKPVYDLDSVGILQMLSAMEETGTDFGGNTLTGPAPHFYKGAVVTPVYEPLFLQMNKLRQKVEAGAVYIQTQAIFDLDDWKRFMDEADKAGIRTHFLVGIIPLRGAGMANRMNQCIPGIRVPQEIVSRLEAAAEEGRQKGIKGLPAKLGLEIAAELAARIRDEHLSDGIHLMPIGAEKKVPELLRMAGLA